MSEALKCIMERYSCRDFTGEPLTKEQVDVLVKAALAAPSAVNRMPWHIVMCTDKTIIDEMDASGMEIVSANEDKTTYNRLMERGGSMFYNAPAMMVVFGDRSDWATLDSGILIQNVALAAHALGLGNVICGMLRIPLDGPKGEDFKKRLKFPADHDFAISIMVGKAKSGKEPHELDMNKVNYV